MKSNYDKFPVVQVSSDASVCAIRWDAIVAKIRERIRPGKFVVCIECYPGVFEDEVEAEFASRLPFATVLRARNCYKPAAQIVAQFQADLTDDPVFGRMNNCDLADFFDDNLANCLRQQIDNTEKLTAVIGTGAVLLARRPDLLIYADMARWEIQMRQRKNEIANLGLANYEEHPSLKYKRAFFIDWRAADRLKQRVLHCADFILDTNDRHCAKMISAAAMFEGLKRAVHQPFRVVPFFDPGPWGGQWMKEVCDLPRDTPNYAWCFDCVPEENSLLLGFGHARFEIPSLNLVFEHPRELLGDSVHDRFGAEFPIRFDFLDTVDGGNLSFQVHPLTEYIQEKFGIPYTQDESYYLLDAKEDGCVYLGLREGIDREAMVRDLREAQTGAITFPAEKYVNKFPARKHNHFLIPAGTPHCSGRNSMVLEISATPYIFTFKMWDWGRLGLDGRPRPIHLDHAIANIQWDRTTSWVKTNLVNRVQKVAEGPGWREEFTGLHEREFIETRRHWFTGVVPHDTNGGVNVLNLVEGREAIVESPTDAFEPLVVHYAETFIVPASVGPYSIRPHGEAEGKQCATIKASVRSKG